MSQLTKLDIHRPDVVRTCRDFDYLESSIWYECIATALQFNPVRERPWVVDTLKRVVASGWLSDNLSLAYRDSLDRQLLGAYRFTDAESRAAHRELFEWLGASDDTSYLEGAPYQTAPKFFNPRLRIFGEPVVVRERRDVMAFPNAGVNVVSVLFNLATIDSQPEEAFRYQPIAPVAELIEFKKVN